MPQTMEEHEQDMKDSDSDSDSSLSDCEDRMPSLPRDGASTITAAVASAEVLQNNAAAMVAVGNSKRSTVGNSYNSTTNFLTVQNNISSALSRSGSLNYMSNNASTVRGVTSSNHLHVNHLSGIPRRHSHHGSGFHDVMSEVLPLSDWLLI